MNGFGKRVWDAVEQSQGYAFIASDIASCEDADAYARAVQALEWERESVRRLAQLVRSYERDQTLRVLSTLPAPDKA